MFEHSLFFSFFFFFYFSQGPEGWLHEQSTGSSLHDGLSYVQNDSWQISVKEIVVIICDDNLMKPQRDFWLESMDCVMDKTQTSCPWKYSWTDRLCFKESQIERIPPSHTRTVYSPRFSLQQGKSNQSCPTAPSFENHLHDMIL